VLLVSLLEVAVVFPPSSSLSFRATAAGAAVAADVVVARRAFPALEDSSTTASKSSFVVFEEEEEEKKEEEVVVFFFFSDAFAAFRPNIFSLSAREVPLFSLLSRAPARPRARLFCCVMSFSSKQKKREKVRKKYLGCPTLIMSSKKKRCLFGVSFGGCAIDKKRRTFP